MNKSKAEILEMAKAMIVEHFQTLSPQDQAINQQVLENIQKAQSVQETRAAISPVYPLTALYKKLHPTQG